MTKPKPYRAIPIDGTEFVYGWYVFHEKHYIFESEWISSKDSILGAAIEVQPSTIGQQVDLKDKDGKEIYEGSRICHGGVKYTIEWNEDIAGFEYRAEAWSKDQHSWSLTCDIACECSIIGNVHKEEKP